MKIRQFKIFESIRNIAIDNVQREKYQKMKFIDETKKLFNLKMTKLITKFFIKIVQNKNKIAKKFVK